MVDLSTVSPAIALGPLDGRYRAVAAPLVNHLSEAALNRARLQVEVEWLIHLTDGGILPGAPRLSESEKAYLRGVVEAFGAEEIAELGVIEAETRHDVKAVEYLLKRRLAAAAQSPSVVGADGGPTVLPTVGEIVHIFCTSEDINNLSYALTIRAAVEQVWLPAARGLVEDLAAMAHEYADAAMLARTHSRPPPPRSARSWRSWPTGCAVRCAVSRPPSTWARSTAPPALSARTSSPFRAPIGRRWAAASSSTWG